MRHAFFIIVLLSSSFVEPASHSIGLNLGLSLISAAARRLMTIDSELSYSHKIKPNTSGENGDGNASTSQAPI